MQAFHTFSQLFLMTNPPLGMTLAPLLIHFCFSSQIDVNLSLVSRSLAFD